MPQSLPDVQAQKINSIKLSRVGVQGVDFPIYIKTKSGEKMLCFSKVNMFVSLKENIKGINMCYSDDTEVLTDLGWKNIATITKKDKIATLNQESRDINYHYPKNLFNYPSPGELYQFKNNQINLQVTGNHNMLFITSQDKLYWKQAQEPQTFNTFYTGSNWQGKDKKTITLPDNRWHKKSTLSFETEDFMKILGFWLAEGYSYWKFRKQRIVGFCNLNKFKLDEIKQILLKYNIPSGYVYQEKRLVGIKLINKPLFDYLNPLGHSPKRYIPKEIKELKSKYLQILLNYYLSGDGSFNSKGCISFYTASKKLAEDIQEISLKCDKGCSFHKKVRKYGFIPGSISYAGYIHKNNTLSLDKHNITKVPYTRKVYCLEVPNHTLLVKRGDTTPIWCGNSRLPRGLMKYRKTSFTRWVLWKFLYDLKKHSDTTDAYAEINFKYFVEKQAPETKEPSAMAYDCAFIGHIDEDNKYTFHMKVMALGTSNCPCSRELSLVDKERGIGMGAHGQRSKVTVTVETLHKKVMWIEDLIELVEKEMSCEIYPVLKRPDEKYVTEKAYNNPKFVEDISRDVAYALQKTKALRWYKIKVVNEESIHAHDAVSYLSRQLKGKGWVDSFNSLRRF
jgi:GTP cyclohydrolase I